MDSDETKSECEQYVPITLDAWGLFLVSAEDSAAALDTGAAANLCCSVGMSAIIVSLGRWGAGGSRPTLRRRASALGMGDSVRDVTQLISWRGSLGIRANSPRSRSMLIF